MTVHTLSPRDEKTDSRETAERLQAIEAAYIAALFSELRDQAQATVKSWMCNANTSRELVILETMASLIPLHIAHLLELVEAALEAQMSEVRPPHE